MIRSRDEDGATKHDYYLSNAPPETLPGVLARVAKAEHRVEDACSAARARRGWPSTRCGRGRGWHHHQALSLIAAWFLVQEARRGKKGDAGVDGAAGARRVGVAAAGGVRV